jgi:hypothetical protein
MASSSARAASKSGVACCFCRVTRSVRHGEMGPQFTSRVRKAVLESV